jgi:glycosyltransferase involved in cell wall biosynthesis
MKGINNLPTLDLITGNEGKFRVSESITTEFENAISADGRVRIAEKSHYFISRLFFRAWKHLLVNRFLHCMISAFLGLVLFTKKDQMAVLMGPRFQKTFPHFFRKGLKAIYMFDAWPSYHNYISRFVNDFNVDFIFVSSKQSARKLNERIGKSNVFWVPEGVDPDEYKFYPYHEKNIDILSFGRNYKLYHNEIADRLLQQNVNYKFPEEGKMVFPDRQSFIDGLGRSKISVCFPTNITHPERAGNIETMTNRYLQSMAAKCLIIGKAPEEMKELFGYNPVVEVNMDDPAGQIADILSNFENYIELIERNYNKAINEHTWGKRWESIVSIMSRTTNPKN